MSVNEKSVKNKSIISRMIFAPYFLFSKRVAATFTNDLSPHDGLDMMVKPCARFLEDLTRFLRRLKLFIIPFILSLAALTFFVVVYIEAAV